jgi:replication fork protection complex subunit Csm3/Swi3
MVEKTGHKTLMVKQRMEWISEEKRAAVTRAMQDEMEEMGPPIGDGARAVQLNRPGTDPEPETARSGDADDVPGQGERRTPDRLDLFDDDDLYGATPRKPAHEAARNTAIDDGGDLDALMNEMDGENLDGNGGRHRVSPSQAFRPVQTDQFAEDEAAMAEMDGLW